VRNNLLPAESSTATWNGAQGEELLLRRQIAALYVRFEVVEPPEPIALASLNPNNQPPDQELAIPLSSRFYYGIHVCKCKQIKKEINSPVQHAKRFQRPSPWQALGIHNMLGFVAEEMLREERKRNVLRA
jgi:hypothetical protein